MIRGLPRRSVAKKLLASSVLVGGALALTFGGAFATLTANATGTQSVSSGTLQLTLSNDTGSQGFSGAVPPMAPGDVYNIYVDLNNTGTLSSAAGMTLGWAATPANALTNGSITGAGLKLTITQCSVAWSSGSCSGTTTSILASTALSAASPANLNTAALAAGASLKYLQFSLTLVQGSENETSNNGTLPSPTIQGLSTSITWTFTETQRAAVTTNN